MLLSLSWILNCQRKKKYNKNFGHPIRSYNLFFTCSNSCNISISSPRPLIFFNSVYNACCLDGHKIRESLNHILKKFGGKKFAKLKIVFKNAYTYMHTYLVNSSDKRSFSPMERFKSFWVFDIRCLKSSTSSWKKNSWNNFFFHESLENNSWNIINTYLDHQCILWFWFKNIQIILEIGSLEKINKCKQDFEFVLK